MKKINWWKNLDDERTYIIIKPNLIEKFQCTCTVYFLVQNMKLGTKYNYF